MLDRMDDDIHFGEVEETAPRTHVRPDQNKHFAVVRYQTPGQDDLPIYVDVDVLREMEAHASSDTTVELGGVLLGGQYNDDEGRPFVVVTDGLRAEHYESTKGSFKFTHQTWSTITRQCEEFPAETRIVGWYHTHPGWGVFLSGMDTFICDHFFAKPLDVALVIDPCQSERAFFQWDGRGDRTRPTRGFYLIGSRFRLPELELFAAQLEGRTAMPNDPRYAGVPGAYPTPIVQIAEPRSTWLQVAVLGMLTAQFLVVGLLAWRLLEPLGTTAVSPPADLAAQRDMLDRIIGDLEVAPDGVVRSMELQRKENEQLQAVNLGLAARLRELEQSNDRALATHASLEKKTQDLQLVVDGLREDQQGAAGEIRELRGRLSAYEGSEDGTGADGGLWGWLSRWRWYVGGTAAAILLAAAVVFAYFGPGQRGRSGGPDGDSQDSAQERDRD